MAEVLRPWAVLKTEGTVFPDTDLLATVAISLVPEAIISLSI